MDMKRSAFTDEQLEEKAVQFQAAAGRENLGPAKVYETNIALRDAMIELVYYRQKYERLEVQTEAA